MKKIILSLAAALVIGTSAFADEGMWMLPLLQKMNIKTMKAMGCKLSAEDIYSINHSSLKDAIVHFGGGCTGEVISDQGLLVTNHHCGYSNIQKLSTPEHNYLEDGYWAMNLGEELPAAGLTVTFLENMTEVTSILTKAYDAALELTKDEEAAEKARKAAEDELKTKAEADYPNCKAQITSFYNTNVYYLIVYKTYKDIRFVGAPPASVGKFGGETDNWMWPRHTGDFSMFRIYAGPDNEPAEYSENNVPYRPKKSLKISLKGVKEGDFSFIMGYPGRTQRFQTAAQLQNMIDEFMVSVGARTARQEVMWEGMESDPTIRLQYADKYASSANGWKKWQGEKLAFEKLNIIGREKEKEQAFMAWVNQDQERVKKYGDALEEIERIENLSAKPAKEMTLLVESIYNIGTNNVYSRFMRVYGREIRQNPADSVNIIKKAVESAKGAFKDINIPLEKKMAKRMLNYYRELADTSAYLNGIGDFATMDIDKYVEDLFDNSIFASVEKLDQLAQNPNSAAIKNDPEIKLYEDFFKVYMKKAQYATLDHEAEAKASKAFAAGILEWEAGKPSYPDANSTMRLTYGKVGGYSPKNGMWCNHYTTLDGVMEKEDPNNYEFIVPARLKELWKAKDYGQYADATGNLPTCFLTNNDITGGNSGSPVLNAKGELIGLAFDGNWESMSSDVMFEPDLQRCICVDIRYVLFMMDKYGKAGWLLKEMNIVK
ncbi:MAG: S46 family peptidase [Bacteroidales bacterium]|nr:S46 family peptidase [Bacteroidales bacterium]MCR5363240.1 S46 family peptidase [Bacteroidales bacterium]